MYRNRHTRSFRTLVMAMVCLFLFNQLVWSYPTDALAPPTGIAEGNDTRQELLDAMEDKRDLQSSEPGRQMDVYDMRVALDEIIRAMGADFNTGAMNMRDLLGVFNEAERLYQEVRVAIRYSVASEPDFMETYTGIFDSFREAGEELVAGMVELSRLPAWREGHLHGGDEGVAHMPPEEVARRQGLILGMGEFDTLGAPLESDAQPVPTPFRATRNMADPYPYMEDSATRAASTENSIEIRISGTNGLFPYLRRLERIADNEDLPDFLREEMAYRRELIRRLLSAHMDNNLQMLSPQTDVPLQGWVGQTEQRLPENVTYAPHNHERALDCIRRGPFPVVRLDPDSRADDHYTRYGREDYAIAAQFLRVFRNGGTAGREMQLLRDIERMVELNQQEQGERNTEEGEVVDLATGLIENFNLMRRWMRWHCIVGVLGNARALVNETLGETPGARNLTRALNDCTEGLSYLALAEDRVALAYGLLGRGETVVVSDEDTIPSYSPAEIDAQMRVLVALACSVSDRHIEGLVLLADQREDVDVLREYFAQEYSRFGSPEECLEALETAGSLNREGIRRLLLGYVRVMEAAQDIGISFENWRDEHFSTTDNQQAEAFHVIASALPADITERYFDQTVGELLAWFGREEGLDGLLESAREAGVVVAQGVEGEEHAEVTAEALRLTQGIEDQARLVIFLTLLRSNLTAEAIRLMADPNPDAIQRCLARESTPYSTIQDIITAWEDVNSFGHEVPEWGRQHGVFNEEGIRELVSEFRELTPHRLDTATLDRYFVTALEEFLRWYREPADLRRLALSETGGRDEEPARPDPRRRRDRRGPGSDRLGRDDRDLQNPEPSDSIEIPILGTHGLDAYLRLARTISELDLLAGVAQEPIAGNRANLLRFLEAYVAAFVEEGCDPMIGADILAQDEPTESLDDIERRLIRQFSRRPLLVSPRLCLDLVTNAMARRRRVDLTFIDGYLTAIIFLTDFSDRGRILIDGMRDLIFRTRRVAALGEPDATREEIYRARVQAQKAREKDAGQEEMDGVSDALDALTQLSHQRRLLVVCACAVAGVFYTEGLELLRNWNFLSLDAHFARNDASFASVAECIQLLERHLPTSEGIAGLLSGIREVLENRGLVEANILQRYDAAALGLIARMNSPEGRTQLAQGPVIDIYDELDDRDEHSATVIAPLASVRFFHRMPLADVIYVLKENGIDTKKYEEIIAACRRDNPGKTIETKQQLDEVLRYRKADRRIAHDITDDPFVAMAFDGEGKLKPDFGIAVTPDNKDDPVAGVIVERIEGLIEQFESMKMPTVARALREALKRGEIKILCAEKILKKVRLPGDSVARYYCPFDAHPGKRGVYVLAFEGDAQALSQQYGEATILEELFGRMGTPTKITHELSSRGSAWIQYASQEKIKQGLERRAQAYCDDKVDLDNVDDRDFLSPEPESEEFRRVTESMRQTLVGVIRNLREGIDPASADLEAIQEIVIYTGGLIDGVRSALAEAVQKFRRVPDDIIRLFGEASVLLSRHRISLAKQELADQSRREMAEVDDTLAAALAHISNPERIIEEQRRLIVFMALALAGNLPQAVDLLHNQAPTALQDCFDGRPFDSFDDCLEIYRDNVGDEADARGMFGSMLEDLRAADAIDALIARIYFEEHSALDRLMERQNSGTLDELRPGSGPSAQEPDERDLQSPEPSNVIATPEQARARMEAIGAGHGELIADGLLTKIEEGQKIAIVDTLIPEGQQEELKRKLRAESRDVEIVTRGKAEEMASGPLAKNYVIILDSALAAQEVFSDDKCKAQRIVLDNYRKNEREDGCLFLDGAVALARALLSKDPRFIQRAYLSLTGDAITDDEASAMAKRPRINVLLPAIEVAPVEFEPLKNRAFELLLQNA